MATAGDPTTASDAPTGIQTPPEGDASRIPLPPMAPAPAVVPESHLARVRFLDGLLVLLVLAFAFLCASFKASNTDAYLHLATGRLIAQGEYTFGKDPFTFTAEGTWVNHAWLYDLVTYAIYSAGEWGGLALVVLKAILVALAAALMIKTGSVPGQRRWIPVTCMLLAVLAMSPRMWLQPHVASFVLLAMTLYLLTRPAESRSLWYLPLVCLLWVNLDVWFLLGPVTIFLFLVGEAIQGSPNVKRLALVLVASVAACLVNPHHVNAFTVLPVGLLRTGAMETFRGDLFRGYFVSPFERVYLTPTFGLSVAGLSYFVLLAVSFVSFAVTAVWHLDGLRYWRVLVWLAFALLAGWNTRAVPFFAVVAGPIASLNFLDLAVKLLGTEPRPERRWQRLAVAGRVLTILAAVALVAATVPGWLQAQPYHKRQVGWGVEIDPGLRDAAKAVAAWREQGMLPQGQNWFNTSPEVVNYFSWFCPGERCFVDGRLELFGGVAKDMVAVRNSLSGADRPRTEQVDPAPPAWRRVFGEREIGFLIFYSPDLANSNWALTSLERLYSNPDEFEACYAEGSTAIFAWRAPQSARFADPKDGDRKKQPPLDPRLVLDFNARAFGKGAVTAPAEPARPAGAGTWWQRALEAKGGTPAESLSAIQQLKRFEGMVFRYQVENERTFIAAMASMLYGVPPGPGGPLGVLLPTRTCLSYTRDLFPEGDRTQLGALAIERLERFLRIYDSGPVASLYLALRNAREGLAKNPDDITTQFYLAQAYRRLHYQTREYTVTTVRTPNRDIPVFPGVKILRQAQMAAAGQSVLKVNPRVDQARDAHMLLASVFSHPHEPYFESHVKHVKEVFRLNKLLGPRPGITREQFGEYLKSQEENVKNLDKQLKSRRDQYEVDGSRYRKEDVLHRADLAVRQGLAETAVTLLTTADPKLLRDPNNPGEAPGINMMIDLLFGLGRLDDVREVLGIEGKGDSPIDRRNFGTHPLGLPAYEWFAVLLGAATGDYESSDRHLADCVEKVQKSQFYPAMMARLEIAPLDIVEKEGDARLVAGMLAGMAVLDGAQQATQMPLQLVRALPTRLFQARSPHLPKRDEEQPFQAGVRFLMDRMQSEADLWTLRAWLALEAGWIDRAKEYAGKALALADLGPDVATGQRYMMRFRSQPLAGLVQLLATNKGLRK